MTDQTKIKTSPDHEKRIRERIHGDDSLYTNVRNGDLRALLSDLDAMRGALKRIACIQNKMFGDDWEEIEDAREIARAALSEAKAGGWVAVPVEPTEAQWGGLARDIMLAFDMNAKSPALLLSTLRNLGHDIPQWLLDEIKDAGSTHVLSKGTRAVLIYRAMLAARPTTPPKEQA